MTKKAMVIAGYVLLFTAAVAMFILRGIDGESVRPALEAAFKENTGADLKMKSLELSLPFSATLIDAELTTADKRGRVRLDSLEISPVYWKLVFLTPTVRLVMRSRQGWIRMDVAPGVLYGRSSMSLEADKFPVDKAILMLGGSELPLAADVSAVADFTAPHNFPAGATGKASFTLTNMESKAGTIWGFLLAGPSPKSAKCSLEIRDRELHTKNCSASTPLGIAELRVASKILDDASSSALSGAVVLNPKGKLVDAISALYSRYLKPDGAYYFPVSGTLANPKFGL